MTLFFKAFNTLILVMYRLQFYRFISECFASNFVLFLNERDGLSKWDQHNITSHVKGDIQWSRFLRELFFSRELFFRIVKKPRKSQKFESEEN